LQNHSARTVAKQDAGRAVVPVQDAGEHFGADNQRIARTACLDHGVGGCQCIDKAAAHRLYVVRGRALVAQFGLHQARRAGENVIGSGSSHHNQVQILGSNARIFQRLTRGLCCQMTGTNTGIGKMALMNTGTLDNPLIGGFDTLLSQLKR
jgi:hypothetical protein